MYRYEPPAVRMPKSNLNCTEETKEKATKKKKRSAIRLHWVQISMRLFLDASSCCDLENQKKKIKEDRKRPYKDEIEKM